MQWSAIQDLNASESLFLPALLGIRLASVNNRDPPWQRLSARICSAGKCPFLAQGWWCHMGSTWGRQGQGGQRGPVLGEHNWNPWPCYWAPTTHGRSPAAPETGASKAVFGVDTDDAVPCLNQKQTLCEWDFLFSLRKKKCLPKCQGESQVPGEKVLSSSFMGGGTQSSSLPFIHLLTCLMCQVLDL